MAFPFAALLSGFGLTSAFVTNPISRHPPLPSRHTGLFSTTESNTDSKKSSDENEDRVTDNILAGLDEFAAQLSSEDAVSPMAELDVDLLDEDFVLVGGRAAMEKDEALTILSSEVSIWTNLRKRPYPPNDRTAPRRHPPADMGYIRGRMGPSSPHPL